MPRATGAIGRRCCVQETHRSVANPLRETPNRCSKAGARRGGAAARAPPAARPAGGRAGRYLLAASASARRDGGAPRTMPEAVQGASSRMASKRPAIPPRRPGAPPRRPPPPRASSEVAQAGQGVVDAAAAQQHRPRARPGRAHRGPHVRAGGRSCRRARRRRRAVQRAAAGPDGAASPSSNSGAASWAAASCTEQAPSAKPGNCCTGRARARAAIRCRDRRGRMAECRKLVAVRAAAVLRRFTRKVIGAWALSACSTRCQSRGWSRLSFSIHQRGWSPVRHRFGTRSRPRVRRARVGTRRRQALMKLACARVAGLRLAASTVWSTSVKGS